jgi:hypothetical protein
MTVAVVVSEAVTLLVPMVMTVCNRGVNMAVAAEGLPAAALAVSSRENDVRAKRVPAFVLAVAG